MSKTYKMLAICPICKTEKEVEVKRGKDPRGWVDVECDYCGYKKQCFFDSWSFKKPVVRPSRKEQL